MKKNYLFYLFFIFALLSPKFILADDCGKSGTPGSITGAKGTYLTHQYGDLCWMVTNSKEGTSSASSYNSESDKQNGSYYTAAQKTTACPDGWRLPTWDEALALKAIIDADRAVDSVKWWTQVESGAYAGVRQSSWANWEQMGVWRLADRESDGREFCTMTSRVAGGDNGFTVDGGTTSTPRWYSVRCVKGAADVPPTPTVVKPVAFYLKNLPIQRIGTDSDEDIISDLESDGFLVVELDCQTFPATSPELESKLQEFHANVPEFLKAHTPQGVDVDLYTVLYVPEGYRVKLNVPIWNLVTYGAERNLERIMKSYNEDVVPKYNIPAAVTPEDMVGPDGNPLDYNLYIDFIYPSGTPAKKVPLLLNFSSNAPRFSPFSPGDEVGESRIIYPAGFLTSGYAFANMDHCFIPTAKRGVYGHFNSYSLDQYNAVAYVTSGIRYIRSVADQYNLNGKIGTMGISKASYSAVIAANVHNDQMQEWSDLYGPVNPNQPYQGYSSTVDVSYAASGDGTLRVPAIIDAESSPMVTSMGYLDKFTYQWDNYPIMLKHLNKVDNIHLDLWMEDVGHTLPTGTDFPTGLDRYSMLKKFFDFYLKPDEYVNPEVLYILPKENAQEIRTDGTFRTLFEDILPDMGGLSTDDKISVRFVSPMNTSVAANYLQVVKESNGQEISGEWNSSLKGTLFRFTPSVPLEMGETYVIKVLSDIPGISGGLLSNEVTRTFIVTSGKKEEIVCGSGGTPRSITGKNGTYLTHQYGNLCWMVTNSKEGTPEAAYYSTNSSQVNGYYYTSDQKASACPGDGWRLPTWDEAQAFKLIIDANRAADSVKWWTQKEYGAYAGRYNGSWGSWETQGIWRLANRYEMDGQFGDRREFCTITSGSSGTFSVDGGTTNTPRWYSVRCVTDEFVLSSATGIDKIKNEENKLNLLIQGNNIHIQGLKEIDNGAFISIYNMQGILLAKTIISDIHSTTISLKQFGGVYILVLSGKRNLAQKVRL